MMHPASRFPSPKLRLLAGKVLLAALLLALAAGAALAQTSSGATVALIGNHPNEASMLHPMAHANSSLQLRMQITLSLRNRPALDQLIRDQQDPSSPRYQQWLTPQQFTDRFGPSQRDVDAVAQWLNAQGFTVTASSRANRYIRFTGTVADAARVFGIDIMAFGDGSAYSNTTDPAIPARFAGVIGAVGGLSNFLHSHAFVHGPAGSHLSADAAHGWPSGPLALLDSGPEVQMPMRPNVSSGANAIVNGFESFGPSDFYSFYDEGPLLKSGVNGRGGDCIAIIGDSDYLSSAIPAFNTQFGLPGSSITPVFVDSSNPGVNNDETEALLDLEWSHSVAPGAPIVFYLGDDSTATNGAIVDAIQRAVNDNICGVISVSFGLCGGMATLYTVTLHNIYVAAAAHGQSIFVASGDFGAAGAVQDPITLSCVPGTSRNINELGGDPIVTEVGGTGFNPVYDGDNNVPHVAESAWNDGGGATGGGASVFFTKPSYQTGTGVPADGRRDVPDVALIASPNFPGVFIAVDQTCLPPTNSCTGAGPVVFLPIGGTSVSAPTWAGISKLIAQLKHKRLGPLNTRIYTLANEGLAASGFYDVITGNNNFNGVAGFKAGVGFDLTTGWGTVDISTFANKFAGAATPTPTGTPSPTPTQTPTPTPTQTKKPTPTATATVVPATPQITSIPGMILVGDLSGFDIIGTGFTKGSVVNFFVSGLNPLIRNQGPLTPDKALSTSTLLHVVVPATVLLGQGFVSVVVVNTDTGFKMSNPAYALLQGDASAGIPTIESINGKGLDPTSYEPDFATNNVATVVVQGTTVKIGGTGFDTVNGVHINLFCDCSGGKVEFGLSPGTPGLTSTQLTFMLPAIGKPNSPVTGPGSFVVINASFDDKFSSNAVSVPIGEQIAVKSVTQPLSTSPITVNGAGFSTFTVINFFNTKGGKSVNLGGLKPDGTPKITLTFISETQFTFTTPGGAMPGPSYVEAFNPPFVPFSSSGTGPGGAFTLK